MYIMYCRHCGIEFGRTFSSYATAKINVTHDDKIDKINERVVDILNYEEVATCDKCGADVDPCGVKISEVDYSTALALSVKRREPVFLDIKFNEYGERYCDTRIS